jgi:hypothetical protein
MQIAYAWRAQPPAPVPAAVTSSALDRHCHRAYEEPRARPNGSRPVGIRPINGRVLFPLFLLLVGTAQAALVRVPDEQKSIGARGDAGG